MRPELPYHVNHPRNPHDPRAYDRVAFFNDHYLEVVKMFQTIMEYLRVPNGEGGGSSLWEEVAPITFVPLYVTFQDTPQEVIDNTTYMCTDYYNTSYYKHMPLFKVEGNTYAIPLPFEELTDSNRIYLYYVGTPYVLGDGHIALFEPDRLNIPFVESFSGNEERHNHAIVSGLENHLSLIELTDKPDEFTFNRIRPIEDRQVLGG